jgi:hypothetical protein
MGKIAFLNHSIGPNRLQQMVLANQVSMVFDEDAKGVEDLGSQFYRLTITKEPAFYHFQAKRAELIHTARLCGHEIYYDPDLDEVFVQWGAPVAGQREGPVAA